MFLLHWLALIITATIFWKPPNPRCVVGNVLLLLLLGLWDNQTMRIRCKLPITSAHPQYLHFYCFLPGRLGLRQRNASHYKPHAAHLHCIKPAKVRGGKKGENNSAISWSQRNVERILFLFIYKSHVLKSQHSFLQLEEKKYSHTIAFAFKVEKRVFTFSWLALPNAFHLRMLPFRKKQRTRRKLLSWKKPPKTYKNNCVLFFCKLSNIQPNEDWALKTLHRLNWGRCVWHVLGTNTMISAILTFWYMYLTVWVLFFYCCNRSPEKYDFWLKKRWTRGEKKSLGSCRLWTLTSQSSKIHRIFTPERPRFTRLDKNDTQVERNI